LINVHLQGVWDKVSEPKGGDRGRQNQQKILWGYSSKLNRLGVIGPKQFFGLAREKNFLCLSVTT